LYVGAVARRIEIELTSARPDGTWTWRAAGALNPRGTLDASLLYEAAKAGDIVRAEAEFGLDGITVVSVEPPRQPAAADPNRIQLIDRPAPTGVTTQLVGGRSRPDGGSDRRRGDDSVPRRGRPSPRPAPTGPAGGAEHAQGNGAGRGPRASNGDAAPRQPHAERGDRPSRTDRPARQPRAAAGPGRSTPRSSGPRGTQGDAEGQHATNRTGAEGGQNRAGAQRQKRLSPGNAHRNAMLESLPVEQRPIAQQLLRGGIPAVRTALHFERERAREEGRPEPSTEGVLALAESLVSRVKAAEWRDRAEAAIKLGDDLAMRDLRSLVSGSDAARDEASRELVVTLREMLERRIEAHRTSWSDEVTKNLDEGHVVRALRLSSRPPDPAARFSAELATRLRDAAGSALSPATPEAQWLSVLLAVVESPVRRTVRPQGLPPDPSPELLDTARQQCGRVPALAPLLGISVPPPPGPVRPNVPTKAPSRGHGRSSRPAGRPARRTEKAEVPTADEGRSAEESATAGSEGVANRDPGASEAQAGRADGGETVPQEAAINAAATPGAEEAQDAEATKPEVTAETPGTAGTPETLETPEAPGEETGGTMEAISEAPVEAPAGQAAAAAADEAVPSPEVTSATDEAGLAEATEDVPPPEVTSAAGALRATEP
jgi:hypothetical protein